MRKEEANYSKGKLNGSIIRWHENGNRSEEGTYESGKQMEYGFGITTLELKNKLNF